jgi:predicted flap endonuclease-1-like 5' DNA nuclease
VSTILNKIKNGTELLPQREGGTKNVSAMEIMLSRVPIEKTEVEKNTKLESVSILLIDITSIDGIGTKRAEKLKSQGVKSVQDLKKVNQKELSEKLQISEKVVSKWVDEAKELINQ